MEHAPSAAPEGLPRAGTGGLSVDTDLTGDPADQYLPFPHRLDLLLLHGA